jgi:glutamate N-acetyltransferase/amino-acid N-acetyltransferase
VEGGKAGVPQGGLRDCPFTAGQTAFSPAIPLKWPLGYGIDDLDQTKIDLYLDDVLVAKNGGRHPAYVGGRTARDETK